MGYEDVETVISRGLTALSAEAFEAAANETGALILDTRKAQEFKDSFIPNAINIGIQGDFAPWVGTLITNIQQPILLVTEVGREEEVITRLSRVGYDQVIGYLDGGMDTWLKAQKETDSIESITAEEFKARLLNDTVIRDVRKPNEYQSEHVIGAENVPLAELSEQMQAFSKTQTNYIHCAGGYRSMIACSILKSRGFDNIVDIQGGFGAIAQADIPKSAFVCPSTL